MHIWCNPQCICFISVSISKLVIVSHDAHTCLRAWFTKDYDGVHGSPRQRSRVTYVVLWVDRGQAIFLCLCRLFYDTVCVCLSVFLSVIYSLSRSLSMCLSSCHSLSISLSLHLSSSLSFSLVLSFFLSLPLSLSHPFRPLLFFPIALSVSCANFCFRLYYIYCYCMR